MNPARKRVVAAPNWQGSHRWSLGHAWDLGHGTIEAAWPFALGLDAVLWRLRELEWACVDFIHDRRFGLRCWEVAHHVLAWLPWVVALSRAGAVPRRGHVVDIALVALHQDHFSAEPIEGRQLGDFLAVVIEFEQSLDCFY